MVLDEGGNAIIAFSSSENNKIVLFRYDSSSGKQISALDSLGPESERVEDLRIGSKGTALVLTSHTDGGRMVRFPGDGGAAKTNDVLGIRPQKMTVRRQAVYLAGSNLETQVLEVDKYEMSTGKFVARRALNPEGWGSAQIGMVGVGQDNTLFISGKFNTELDNGFLGFLMHVLPDRVK